MSEERHLVRMLQDRGGVLKRPGTKLKRNADVQTLLRTASLTAAAIYAAGLQPRGSVLKQRRHLLKPRADVLKQRGDLLKRAAAC